MYVCHAFLSLRSLVIIVCDNVCCISNQALRAARSSKGHIIYLYFKRLCIRIGHYGAIQMLYYYYYYILL